MCLEIVISKSTAEKHFVREISFKVVTLTAISDKKTAHRPACKTAFWENTVFKSKHEDR